MTQSSLWILVIGYVVVGTGAAVAIWVQRPTGGPSHAIMMMILWPFLLPAALLAPAQAVALDAGRLRRLREAEAAVAAAWEDAQAGSAKERASVALFVRRLEAKDARLAEVHAAIARAPDGVRDRLERIADQAAQQVDEGIGVLEDMAAQLTLLRFTPLAEDDDGPDRERVEALLVRVDALAKMASGSELESIEPPDVSVGPLNTASH